jgi:hypothetical protein
MPAYMAAGLSMALPDELSIPSTKTWPSTEPATDGGHVIDFLRMIDNGGAKL